MSGRIFGFDVGIGSVGWAVIDTDLERIEGAGVRLFDSGERKGKETLCQQRRGFRSTRRVIRRRAHRISRLKAHLQVIGLITKEEIEAYYNGPTEHPLILRERGLIEKLSRAEFAAALLHISKHRGYNDFYSLDDESLKLLTKEELKEYESERTQVEKFEALLKNLPEGSTPAQVFLHHPKFKNDGCPKYLNSKHQAVDEYVLVSRDALKKEASRIWAKQAEYYDCLTDDAKAKAFDIIFRQRDFEDGPGDPNDAHRKYGSFLDTIGKCTYYGEERGCRFTVIGDLYVLINRLSQNRYIDNATGEVRLSAEAASEMIKTALSAGALDKKTIEKILKERSFSMINNPDGDSPNSCLAFINAVKPVLESEGMAWSELISEDQLNMEQPSLLNRIGEIISFNRTPQRRIDALKKAGLSHKASVRLANVRPRGTVKVCYRFMRDAVNAFVSGDIYGNFQAEIVKQQAAKAAETKRFYKLPPITDEEYINNPVVFRSINETRKVLNAMIEKYGSPSAINIEVASDLARSFRERNEIARENRRREKENDAAKQRIAELTGVTKGEVTGKQCEKYALGENQYWKCPYCGESIDMQRAISVNDRSYEVDHIIPFSLILDNTHNNKVLVHHACNQKKGQRTPLMYLDEASATEFVKWTNKQYKDSRISKTKYRYLLQKELDFALFEEWKSRNINDTRYISKYLVRYLSENLQFASDKKNCVHAVKGAITARLRRSWLNEATWGGEKTALREENSLHHAVDAVVIANCTPLSIALAEESMRLYRLYREEGRQRTEEWQRQFDYAVERLVKYNHVSREYAEAKLANIRRVPALLPRLREEVDLRFCNCNIENEAEYKSAIRNFYFDDPAFANSIELPIVSIKADRKYSGEVTAANPVKKSAGEGRLFKRIGDDNTTYYDDSNYYCTELYADHDGRTIMRGIKMSEVRREGKKLILVAPLPNGYSEHIMYLFKGDYIVAQNKGSQSFHVYYNSVEDAGRSKIKVLDPLGGRKARVFTVGKNCTIKKYNVSILGELGGSVKCGKPLSLIKGSE